jgi:hypothetical protein
MIKESYHMSYVPSDQIVYTNKCLYRMKYHKLYEDEVLLAFNYPDSTKKTSSFFAPSVYENVRDFGKYRVYVVYRWDQKAKKWILITCWRAWKTNWWSRPIEWWYAHVLGR